jgi:hypothetical protein
MLDSLLTYQHKKRPSAGDVLQQEFVPFHVNHSIAPAKRGKLRRTASVSLRGSVSRQTLSLEFKKYERSLTTLLATILSKTELAQLWITLKEQRGKSGATSVAEAAMMAAQEADDDDDNHNGDTFNAVSASKQKLNVVSVGELRAIWKTTRRKLRKKAACDLLASSLILLPSPLKTSRLLYSLAACNAFTACA